MLKDRLPALTIFIGSFLIFGVQPMLGRTLLPAFGGTAAVWTTCLATYQVLLLVGYWYAHVVAGRGKELSTFNAQRSTSNQDNKAMHIVLLALAVAWVAGFAYGRPWLMAHIGNGAYPALEVLLCVLAFAGLPYVLLSANSTLIQAWVSRREGVGRREEGSEEHPMSHVPRPKSDVYRLYAVSNAGSLLGLLCYPFLVEPFLSLNAQWYGFAGCLAVYAGLLWKVGVRREEVGGRREEVGVRREEKTKGNQAILLWLLLPATSTFLLNAVTAHLSTDVTPIPLLWVALLAAFLVSYIIGFSKIGEKGVWVWCVVAMIPLVFCAYATGLKGGRGFLFNLIPGILLVLLGSAFLHSWLYRIRPEARLLTRYYLCLAAGGAMGGLLSGIVAPLVFTSVMEYPLALVALAGLLAFYVWRNTPKEFRWVEVAAHVAAVSVVYFVVANQFKKNPNSSVVLRTRNFYGCLMVSDTEIRRNFSDVTVVREFQHGDTVHGVQFQPHYLRDRPTSYFGPNGGGLGIMSHLAYTNDKPMSVGIIGLGIGTLAVYGRTNDTYRFFEINPKVVNIAWNTNYFTYLSGCKAKLSVALGDARRVIAAETNRYDVLVIDAYSGDSIPFHLATKEAFRLYLDRLNPGGILAVHISNWHIDLNPLCKAVAKEWGLQLTGVISQPQGIFPGANWVFIGDHRLSLQGLSVRETDWAQVREIALPTDACGSLINLVRYGHRPPEKPLEIDFRSLFQ